MGPYHFTEPIVAQILTQWFQQSSELFFALYMPHSGASSDYYVLNNYAQYDELIMQASPGSVCCATRNPLFPVRGMVDDTFIQRALDWFVEGDYYLIIAPCTYPQKVRYLGDGKSHLELEQELRELTGSEVWVGRDFAFTMPDTYWKVNPAEDALIVMKPK